MYVRTTASRLYNTSVSKIVWWVKIDLFPKLACNLYRSRALWIRQQRERTRMSRGLTRYARRQPWLPIQTDYHRFLRLVDNPLNIAELGRADCRKCHGFAVNAYAAGSTNEQDMEFDKRIKRHDKPMARRCTNGIALRHLETRANLEHGTTAHVHQFVFAMPLRKQFV